MSGRLEQLEALAKQNPDDTFIQYAIALEYVSSDQLEEAIQTLEVLMTKDPDYSASFHQAGRVYERLEKIDDARRCYEQGIEVAAKQGESHAQKEMREALYMLNE